MQKVRRYTDLAHRLFVGIKFHHSRYTSTGSGRSSQHILSLLWLWSFFYPVHLFAHLIKAHKKGSSAQRDVRVLRQSGQRKSLRRQKRSPQKRSARAAADVLPKKIWEPQKGLHSQKNMQRKSLRKRLGPEAYSLGSRTGSFLRRYGSPRRASIARRICGFFYCFNFPSQYLFTIGQKKNWL